MSTKQHPHRTAYAVMRVDAFHDPSTDIEDFVTVKLVTTSEAFARTEVDRLNREHGDATVRYWFQVTRLLDGASEA